MPQTSPMNWTILSMMMMTSIMNILSYSNEKVNFTASPNMTFPLHVTSWKW